MRTVIMSSDEFAGADAGIDLLRDDVCQPAIDDQFDVDVSRSKVNVARAEQQESVAALLLTPESDPGVRKHVCCSAEWSS